MKKLKFRFKLLPATLVILIFVVCGCQSPEKEKFSAPAFALTLAVVPGSYSALIALADQRGYFKAEGLEVTLISRPSGLRAMEAMVLGEAQVATVADIAFAAEVTDNPSIRVLASIGTATGNLIIARKDRNIVDSADLKGKRVGYIAGTGSDYFLYAFLLSKNIKPNELELVNLPPERQADAVVNGEVDAVSAFGSYAYEAKKRLAENAVFWDSQDNLAYHWLLATREGSVGSPEPLERLLKALLKAEDFARDHDVETQSMLVRMWGLDPDYVRDSWPRIRFKVSLNQSVVISLQDYAVWQMKKEGKFSEPPIILNYLNTSILDAVAPEKVTIFR